jgi:hypothetical protein
MLLCLWRQRSALPNITIYQRERGYLAMNIAHILPVANVAQIGSIRQKVEMNLAHLILKYPKIYAKLSKNEFSYMILDNSFVENGLVSMTMEQLIEAAGIVGADEIIIPDTMNPIANIEQANYNLGCYANAIKQYKKMFVLHANSWREAVDIIHNNVRIMDVDTVGMPRPIADLAPCGKGRVLLSKIIREHTNKEVHLLGSQQGVREFIGMDLSCIRSMDTAWFVNPYFRNKLASGDEPHTIFREAAPDVDEETATLIPEYEFNFTKAAIEKFLRKWSYNYDNYR